MRIPRLSWLVLLAACAACSKPEEEIPVPLDPEAANAKSIQAYMKANQRPPDPPDKTRTAGGVIWNNEPPFVRRAFSMSGLAACYAVPGDEHAEMMVHYFARDDGDTIDAHIPAWLHRIKQSDGSDSADKASRTDASYSGIDVVFFEVRGALTGGMALQGLPAPVEAADGLLLGARVAGPKGPLFFRFVGARETVERYRAAFEAMVASIQLAP